MDILEKLKPGRWLLMIILPFAYFAYGGLDGVFAMLMLYGLLALATLTSAIPIIGIFGFLYLANMVVPPYVYALTGLYPSWITWVTLAFFNIVALIMAAISASAFLFGTDEQTDSA